jgi:hypothetical protein
LHHCYKELVGNEKWIRINYETTPKKARISMSVGADEEDKNPRTRSDGKKIANERKRNGGVITYKQKLALCGD